MNAEDAFNPSPDQRSFFASGPASMVLSQLERGLEDASPVIVLTGELGVGKTAVVREAIARWGSRVTPVWFEPEAGAPPEKTLLKQIRAFGGHGRAKDERPELIARMAHALNDITKRGSTPMLIVDDAHKYDVEMLAEVGRIESAAIAADQTLKLLLVGDPLLTEILDREELEILSQRLALSCRLEPMEQADTRQYLNHRVGATNPDAPNAFSRKAAREIHTLTRGVPGAINALADDARARANATNAGVVTPDHMRAVSAATRRANPQPTPAPNAKPQPQAAAPSAPPAPARPAASPSRAIKRPAAQPPSGQHQRPDGPPPGQPERRVAQQRPAAPTPSGQQPRPNVATTPGSPAPAASKPAAPQSATPNAPGGPKHAQPVPAKVKRVPPPPPPAEPVAPAEPAVDLDSSHPRVKEWVSRFTDGQPLRIGGGLPPITNPSAIPEQPIFADEDELLVPPSELPSAAALQAPIPDELPLPPVPPAAIEPAPTVPDPEPHAPEPHAIELPSDAPLVSADALTPPPLVLDEKPAAATPSGSIKRPAGTPPPQATSAAQPLQIAPAPKPAPTARPSGSMPKPGATSAPKPAPAQPAAKGKVPKQQQQPAASAKPAPKAATTRPAAEPPTVLTKNDVKAHKPALRDQEKKPLAVVPPKPATFDDDDDFDETLPSPTVYRVLAALIPIVLILGMAATAIVLSRRSAFDREPDAQQAATPAPTSDSAKAMPAVPVPTASPAPPPLVVTPDTEVTAETQATPDTQATPPIAVAPPPAPAPAKPRFTLSVGTYLFSDRARMRTDQLSRLTHMKSWVVTTTADGSYTYRVMLGEFVKQSEAERMADKLLSNGLVSEALVEKLPQQQ